MDLNLSRKNFNIKSHTHTHKHIEWVFKLDWALNNDDNLIDLKFNQTDKFVPKIAFIKCKRIEFYFMFEKFLFFRL